jgi:hypothetical protein
VPIDVKFMHGTGFMGTLHLSMHPLSTYRDFCGIRMSSLAEQCEHWTRLAGYGRFQCYPPGRIHLDFLPREFAMEFIWLLTLLYAHDGARLNKALHAVQWEGTLEGFPWAEVCSPSQFWPLATPAAIDSVRWELNRSLQVAESDIASIVTGA